MLLYNPTISGSLLVTGSLITTGTITSQTLVVQTITSSVSYLTGSTQHGSVSGNTHQFTGSVSITGSAAALLNVNNGVLYVSSSGNVGIGTTTPVDYTNYRSLHINGSTSTSSAILYLTNSDSSLRGLLFAEGTALRVTIGAQSNHPFTIVTNDTERMRITATGNVGIGTSSPSDKLQVGVDENAYISIANGGSTDVKSGLRFRVGGGGTVYSAMESAASSSGNGYLSFSTIGSSTLAERMRITSGGSLLMAKDAAIGINTTDGSDNGYLALCGAGGDGEARGGYIYLSGNERSVDQGHVTIGAGNVIGYGSVIAFRTGAGVERMRIIGNGRVLIGTTTDGGYLLYVNGNAAGTSGFANVSDGRFKKDITPIENALTKINQLNGVSFNWDKDSRPDLNLDDSNHLGLIAQDVEEILPQVVTTGEDELQTKTITYSDIVPVLIEAIKELSAKNTALEEILQRNNIQ
jgi:hypothetical protein